MKPPIRLLAILGLLQVGAIMAGTLGVRAAAKWFAASHEHWPTPIGLWFDGWWALMFLPLAWVVIAAWIWVSPKASDNQRAVPWIGGLALLILIVSFAAYSIYKIFKAGEIII